MIPDIRHVARPILHLHGQVYDYRAEVEVEVNGQYMVSTITVDGRAETVAFRQSGTGPAQIENPLARKGLMIREEETHDAHG